MNRLPEFGTTGYEVRRHGFAHYVVVRRNTDVLMDQFQAARCITRRGAIRVARKLVAAEQRRLAPPPPVVAHIPVDHSGGA